MIGDNKGLLRLRSARAFLSRWWCMRARFVPEYLQLPGDDRHFGCRLNDKTSSVALGEPVDRKRRLSEVWPIPQIQRHMTEEALAEMWFRRAWIDRAPRSVRLPSATLHHRRKPPTRQLAKKEGGPQLRRPRATANCNCASQTDDVSTTAINTELSHVCPPRSRANHSQSHNLLRRANIAQLTIGSGQLQHPRRMQ